MPSSISGCTSPAIYEIYWTKRCRKCHFGSFVPVSCVLFKLVGMAYIVSCFSVSATNFSLYLFLSANCRDKPKGTMSLYQYLKINPFPKLCSANMPDSAKKYLMFDNLTVTPIALQATFKSFFSRSGLATQKAVAKRIFVLRAQVQTDFEINWTEYKRVRSKKTDRFIDLREQSIAYGFQQHFYCEQTPKTFLKRSSYPHFQQCWNFFKISDAHVFITGSDRGWNINCLSCVQ